MSFEDLITAPLPKKLGEVDQATDVETRCCSCIVSHKQCPICAYQDKKHLFTITLNDYPKKYRIRTKRQ